MEGKRPSPWPCRPKTTELFVFYSGRVCVITLGKLECALSCKIADGIDGRHADPLGPKPLTVILKNLKRC